MPSIKETISRIKSQFESAENNATTSQFWGLSTSMNDLEGSLREYMQENTKGQITQIIDALEAGKELSAEDLELVKLWMVGDAEYYLKMENNYKDWTDELKRLVGEIGKLEGDDLDFKQASKLRAQALDGVRVLGDIVYFLKQQERVKNFENSVQVIDPQERQLIIDVLKGKIRSPRE